MNNFHYTKATSPQEAIDALAGNGQARLVAGGTDLIPLMKEEIVSPDTLVDISAWADGAHFRRESDGLHIGALTSLSAIASHSEINNVYRALAGACKLAATPQLRNMGTIGGNLLQQTRCWYYRGPHNCWLKGGNDCFARTGENEYHAIFSTAPETSPCVSTHPSDPAAALLALNARVRCLTPSGEAETPIEELYALPDADRRTFNTLPPDAILTEIILPPPLAGGKSTYVKAMARAAWGFALAGVAVYVKLDGSRIEDAHIALSGVAPIPIRAREVEALLVGTELSDVDHTKLADLLVANAQPLTHNGYKVHLLQGLFKQAFEEVNA